MKKIQLLAFVTTMLCGHVLIAGEIPSDASAPATPMITFQQEKDNIESTNDAKRFISFLAAYTNAESFRGVTFRNRIVNSRLSLFGATQADHTLALGPTNSSGPFTFELPIIGTGGDAVVFEIYIIHRTPAWDTRVNQTPVVPRTEPNESIKRSEKTLNTN